MNEIMDQQLKSSLSAALGMTGIDESVIHATVACFSSFISLKPW